MQFSRSRSWMAHFKLLKLSVLLEVRISHLCALQIKRKFLGEGQSAFTSWVHSKLFPTFSSSSLSLSPSHHFLTCFVYNISEQILPHKDSRSHPTQASVHDWWQRPLATFSVHWDSVGGLCVYVSVSLSLSVCVGSLLSSQDCYTKPLQMWGQPCLTVWVPVAHLA